MGIRPRGFRRTGAGRAAGQALRRMSFGFDATAPFTIDLYILKFTLAVGFWFKINVASILGVLISFLIFRKL